jgi:hypothetical protein
VSDAKITRVNLLTGEVSTINGQWNLRWHFTCLEPLPCGALLACTAHALYVVKPDTGHFQLLAGTGQRRKLKASFQTRAALEVSFLELQSLAVSVEEKCVYASDFEAPLLRVTLPRELFIAL